MRDGSRYLALSGVRHGGHGLMTRVPFMGVDQHHRPGSDDHRAPVAWQFANGTRWFCVTTARFQSAPSSRALEPAVEVMAYAAVIYGVQKVRHRFKMLLPQHGKFAQQLRR